MEKVEKTFMSEIRSVNEKDFTLEAVISDETIDRYGEVIQVDAWKKRIKRYKEHAVLLSSHKYDKLTNQIGEATKVFVDGGKLVAKFKYYVGLGNQEADWGWVLASKFGKAAYSVGFIPYDATTYDEKDYDEVKAGKKPYRTYTDVELIEVSQVLIPANPSALMKGIESEEDVEMKEYSEMVLKTLEEQEDFAKFITKDLSTDIVTKPDTENYVHIGVSGEEGKHSDHEIRTLTISKSQGIKGHYCVGCKKMTGYLFDKSKGWTHEKAQKWVDEHSKSFEDIENLAFDDEDDAEVYIVATFDEIEEKKKKKPKGGCKDLENEEDVAMFEIYKYMDERLDKMSEDIMERLLVIEEKLTSMEKEDEEFMKELEEIDQKEAEEAKREEENYLIKLLSQSNDALKKAIDFRSAE